jgi:hypothetical protein
MLVKEPLTIPTVPTSTRLRDIRGSDTLQRGKDTLELIDEFFALTSQPRSSTPLPSH